MTDILEATMEVFRAPTTSQLTSPAPAPGPQIITFGGVSDDTDSGVSDDTDTRKATILLASIFSILAVFLAVMFQFTGVFPASWSWSAVIGGLAVFLFVMFLGARFVGLGAVIALFVLTTSLGGAYIVFGIPML